MRSNDGVGNGSLQEGVIDAAPEPSFYSHLSANPTSSHQQLVSPTIQQLITSSALSHCHDYQSDHLSIPHSQQSISSPKSTGQTTHATPSFPHVTAQMRWSPNTYIVITHNHGFLALKYFLDGRLEPPHIVILPFIA